MYHLSQPVLNIRKSFLRYLIVILPAFLFIGVSHILAGVTTEWISTSDTNWGDPANWSNGVPGPDDIAKFGAQAGKAIPVLDQDREVLGIESTNTSGNWNYPASPYKLTVGSAGFIGNDRGNFAHMIELAADQTWNVSSHNPPLKFEGGLSGAYRLTKTGNGTLSLFSNPGFIGGIDFYDGNLYIYATDAIGPEVLRIYGGNFQPMMDGFPSGTILENDVEIYGPGPIGFSTTTGGRTPKLTGNITITGLPNITFGSTDATDHYWMGNIGGSANGLIKSGGRNLVLQGNNNFMGPLINIGDSGFIFNAGKTTTPNELAVLSGLTRIASSGHIFGGGIRVKGGRLALTAGELFNGDIELISPILGLSMLNLEGNFEPTLSATSSGTIAIDFNNYSTALDMSDIGNSYMYLGSSLSSGKYTATSLGAGADDVYRLGTGGGTLTFDSPDNNGVLTGNNDVEIGVNGVGENYAGTVVLNDANDFAGTITVNRDSTLQANVRAANEGSPLGDETNPIVLKGGTLDINRGGQATAREPVVSGDLTVKGAGRVKLDASGSANADFTINSLILDNQDGGSAMSLICSLSNQGLREFLRIQNPPTHLSGVSVDMLTPRLRALNGPYFLHYDATHGLMLQTSETDLDSAGSTDIALATGAKTVTGAKEVFALTCRNGNGFAVSDGGSGKLVLLSGGYGTRNSQSGAIDIKVPVQFGPDDANVEGILCSQSIGGGFTPLLSGDVISDKGLTKFGNSGLQINANGNGGKQHLGLSGRITVLEGTLITSANGTASTDERFPYVTELILNGGDFQTLINGQHSMPIVVGPNGGTLSVSSSTSAYTIDLNGNISGDGTLKFTGKAGININGTENTWSGGTIFALSGSTINVSADSSLGSGDVRIQNSSGNIVLNGDSNIAPMAKVWITGGGLLLYYVGTVPIAELNGIGGSITLGPKSGTGTTKLQLGSQNGSMEIYSAINNNNTNNKRLGAVEKVGNGTLVLGGINGYTGGTEINAGTLIVNGILAKGLDLTAKSGTTLGGMGKILSAVNIEENAILSPGYNGIGILTVSNLNLDDDSKTIFELGDTANDKIVVEGSVTLGGTFEVPESPQNLEGEYVLIKYGTTLTVSSTPTLVVPEGYNPKLVIDEVNKQVLLQLARPVGTILLIK